MEESASQSTLSEEHQQDLNALIKQVNASDISSVRSTLTEIISILNRSSASAKDLKDIIELDPPLSARILKRANSAFYASPREFTEIQEAIVWVGFNEVKELALSQTVCELFEKTEQFQAYSRKLLWRNSVAVALFGKYIYRREFRQRGENSYAAGLLHNIGIIIEDQFLHDGFTQVLHQSAETQSDLCSVEKKVYGFDHTDIGQAVGRSWRFPAELTRAIVYHHDPFGPHSVENGRLIITLALADCVCRERGIGFSDARTSDQELFEQCLGRVGLDRLALDLIGDAVEEEIEKMESSGWL
ncbi:MAG: HDOD domain-containing protein [Deltaproteobacteria bacterium]|nr:HDOD domain-containing protein [Deltaproteobacteria bacterium]